MENCSLLHFQSLKRDGGHTDELTIGSQRERDSIWQARIERINWVSEYSQSIAPL